MVYIRRDLAIEEFWEELKDCFKALCIKCLAIKKDKEWLSLMVTGFLGKEDLEDLKNRVGKEYAHLERLGVTKLDDLLITYDILKANSFLEIVKSLLSGSINFRGQIVKLGENLTPSIETSSPLILEEHFPRISLRIAGSKVWDREVLLKVEEELETFGYRRFDEIVSEWLHSTFLDYSTFYAIIEIPIYFLPLRLGLDLNKNAVTIEAICHKALAPKLKAKLSLKRKSSFREDIYIPVENYMIKEFPVPTKEIDTLIITQSLESPLNKDNVIDCVITSKIGILDKRSEKVENLLRKEVSIADFPKLVTQFVNLEEMRKLLTTNEALVGDKFKEPQLSFQRAIAWLLSILGFQTVELEGTKYKEIMESNKTRRETDMLIFDPEKKDMYIVDVTLRVPDNQKIDDIANLQFSLQRKNIMVKPIIITKDPATETKNNIRKVKVIDHEDLVKIVDMLKRGEIQNAKRIITQ